MSTPHPKRKEHRRSDLLETGGESQAGPQGKQRLRIVILNREAFVLTYIWHLSVFFEQVCPAGLPAWECWSYADLKRPTKLGAASAAVRVANWVVFCQATPAALPAHVQRWAKRWPFKKREGPAMVGFFSLTEADVGSQGKAQTWLRKLAGKVNGGVVDVRDCLWGASGSWGTSFQVTKSTHE